MACRYAGIDGASQTHDVLVADETGAELLSATYAHDEKGLTALCRMLVRTCATFSTVTLRRAIQAFISMTNARNARVPLTRPRVGSCSSGSAANDPTSASGSPAIKPSKYGAASSSSRRRLS
jgi:hypothetical protein